MTFTKEEDWPFPQYYGSCGRTAVFENTGQRLTDFYFKDWMTRVKLSRQLLQMAFKFTNNKDKIALYLTDWSSDNFAVDQFGTLTLIDGENIILVDQQLVQDTRAPGWNVKHTSGSEDSACLHHFCYSSEDLCTRVESDLNFYGVCKGLLVNNPFSREMPLGLLHSIPGEVKRKHPLLSRFISECADPTHPQGRFEAAKELLDILDQL